MICLKCGSDMPEDAFFCGSCGAKIRDKHFDIFHQFTPHGGVLSRFFYYDAEHQPCVKEKACFMEVKEYDAEGNEIYQFTAHKKGFEE